MIPIASIRSKVPTKSKLRPCLALRRNLDQRCDLARQSRLMCENGDYDRDHGDRSADEHGDEDHVRLAQRCRYPHANEASVAPAGKSVSVKLLTIEPSR